MDLKVIAIELVVGFIGLFFLTKFLGKTQITQISAFDFISALILGELVGNAVYDKDSGIKEILFTIIVWGILIYVLEIVTQKWKRTRSFLEGQPTIVIKKGNIDRESLRKSKLDINQLQHLIRSKGVFSLQEVEYAILETDGSISVAKKTDFESPVRSDLNLKSDPFTLPITIIIDGEVLLDNLQNAGLNKQYLLHQLNKQKINDIKEVLYAEYTKEKGLYIQKLH
ncbi:DUF421 domain-containing protein [Bacillus carboniphilus]|uniref:DUF421 domain-containing protein n=1 Tax=Bacillus carboniphilus TaxID=86663 RepID=A0ABY9JWV2_9BACI|nr:DUF421 domain-containing protein [Bacillus carboniphilus]WLR42977.1 DUF421 domain-containing protein [Bacillus carboniphilus]